MTSSHTLICFDLHHSVVPLAISLRPMSYWKFNLCPSFKSLSDCNRFSSMIALNLALSIFPSIRISFPVSAKEKHPHSLTLPSRFTEGMVSATCNMNLFCIQTKSFSQLTRAPSSTFSLSATWVVANGIFYGFLSTMAVFWLFFHKSTLPDLWRAQLSWGSPIPHFNKPRTKPSTYV